MIRALQLIFGPEGAWNKIAEANRHFLWVLFFSTLPMLAGSLAVEGAGLRKWGQQRGEFGMVQVSQELVIRYGVTQLVLALVFLFVASWMLLAISRSFDGRTDYNQAFAAVAYGAGPIFLLRAVDGLPAVNTWFCWAIGAGLAVRGLYHGVAVVLKPEQTKGFGLYMVAALIVVFMTGLSHFVAVAVLEGKLLR